MFAFRSKLEKHTIACDGILKTRNNSKTKKGKSKNNENDLLNNSIKVNQDKIKEITNTSAKLELESIDIDGEAIDIKQLNY